MTDKRGEKAGMTNKRGGKTGMTDKMQKQEGRDPSATLVPLASFRMTGDNSG